MALACLPDMYAADENVRLLAIRHGKSIDQGEVMFDLLSSFPSTKANFRVGLCVTVMALAPALGAAKGYVPSDVEAALLTLVRQDDLRTFGEGQQSFAAQALNIDVATASEIAHVYKSGNDAKANPRFLNRRVLVSGTIDAVQSDSPGRTALVYADTGTTQVRAMTHDEQPSRTSAWRVGSKVVLVCTGAGGTLSLIHI